MKVRLIKSLPNLDGLDNDAVLDFIQTGVASRIIRCVDDNIICYDSDSEAGDLSHRLMDIAMDISKDNEITMIEVGPVIREILESEGGSYPKGKPNIAIFSFINAKPLLGAY